MPTRIENKKPCPRIPTLTFSDNLHSSSQVHIRHVRGLPGEGWGRVMPSLCWSFLRLPVAWIVVVTSLSSLFANCQCLLRGLPQVFRATSPICPRFVGHFWDCLLLGLLLSHLFPPFLPIASAYWEDCRQFSGPRHLLLLPFRRPRYGGAYQKSELAGGTSLSSKNHESFEKFCYNTKYYCTYHLEKKLI